MESNVLVCHRLGIAFDVHVLFNPVVYRSKYDIRCLDLEGFSLNLKPPVSYDFMVLKI